ncbi:Hypothetical predicted protein [Paramuricea clavata]|uniref:Uncharacterized protein n=1 Tax=Paramuricea clavata TaxID=317549 RepID=A0A6S7JF03_PARCT|nr:Hypothetical predicted protein [Paramuricea clavata]
MIQDLLNKFKLWKVIRVVAWIRRFINNCRSKLRRSNSLVTHETQEAEECIVKISQNAKMLENDYEDISKRLGLTPDEEGILRCRGRVTAMVDREVKKIGEEYYQQMLQVFTLQSETLCCTTNSATPRI